MNRTPVPTSMNHAVRIVTDYGAAPEDVYYAAIDVAVRHDATALAGSLGQEARRLVSPFTPDESVKLWRQKGVAWQDPLDNRPDDGRLARLWAHWQSETHATIPLDESTLRRLAIRLSASEAEQSAWYLAGALEPPQLDQTLNFLERSGQHKAAASLAARSANKRDDLWTRRFDLIARAAENAIRAGDTQQLKKIYETADQIRDHPIPSPWVSPSTECRVHYERSAAEITGWLRHKVAASAAPAAPLP